MEETKNQKQEEQERIVVHVPENPHTWLSAYAYVAAFVGIVAIFAAPIVWVANIPTDMQSYEAAEQLQRQTWASRALDGGIILLASGLISKCLNDIRKAVEKTAKKEE